MRRRNRFSVPRYTPPDAVSPDPGTVTIDRYDHPGDFARAAESLIPEQSHYRAGEVRRWAGGTIKGAVRDCTKGKTDHIAEAESLFDSIAFQVDTPRSVWQAAPCGAFPIVPAFLSGHPDSMRRRQRLACDAAPIALYLDLVSSAGIDAAKLERRGVAFLALAMAMCNIRPVEIFAVVPMSINDATGPHHVNLIRIPSAPLDLATACGVLTNPATARLLGYGASAARLGTSHGNWYRGNFPESGDKARDYAGYGRDTYSNALRADLGLGDADFYMPGVGLGDPLTDDPIGFITRAVTEAAAIEAT